MKYNFSAASAGDLKKGFLFSGTTEEYVCLFCGCKYEKGTIYKSGNSFADAEKTMKLHIAESHGGALTALLAQDKKNTGITDTQRDFILNCHMGLSDKEIAEKMDVSPSTVRFQRFNFREKAAQAKVILAVSELLEEQPAKREKAPSTAKNRNIISEEEKIDSFFKSSSPLELKTFAVKNKNKRFVLEIISRRFERGKVYNEKQVNAILKPIYEDHATIRRELIDFGFMERTSDGSEYWVK